MRFNSAFKGLNLAIYEYRKITYNAVFEISIMIDSKSVALTWRKFIIYNL